MRFLPSFLLLLAIGTAQAMPEQEDSIFDPDPGYYTLKPDFVTNLAQYDVHKKLHYVRVSVSLMLADRADVPLLRELDPLIRDVLLESLASREFSAVNTHDGQESLRLSCRDSIMNLFQDKVGRPVVQDVLFLSFSYA